MLSLVFLGPKKREIEMLESRTVYVLRVVGSHYVTGSWGEVSSAKCDYHLLDVTFENEEDHTTYFEEMKDFVKEVLEFLKASSIHEDDADMGIDDRAEILKSVIEEKFKDHGGSQFVKTVIDNLMCYVSDECVAGEMSEYWDSVTDLSVSKIEKEIY
jgi:hypothetical protein